MTVRALTIRKVKVQNATTGKKMENGLLALRGLWVRHKINPVKYQRLARRDIAR